MCAGLAETDACSALNTLSRIESIKCTSQFPSAEIEAECALCGGRHKKRLLELRRSGELRPESAHRKHEKDRRDPN